MTKDQLKTNWDAFSKMKETLEAENIGRTALLHDGKLVAIYNDSGDAYEIGREKYGLGNFSIETFGATPRSLGNFTAYVAVGIQILVATFVGDVDNNQIILVTLVSGSGSDLPKKSYKALLDTGAQVTMISENVVTEVGLQAIGHMQIIPVTGEPVNIEKYRVRVDIPIRSHISLFGGAMGQHDVLRGMDMEVGKLTYNPANHDVLLGMDFISAFHISMYNNSYILSN